MMRRRCSDADLTWYTTAGTHQETHGQETQHGQLPRRAQEVPPPCSPNTCSSGLELNLPSLSPLSLLITRVCYSPTSGIKRSERIVSSIKLAGVRLAARARRDGLDKSLIPDFAAAGSSVTALAGASAGSEVLLCLNLTCFPLQLVNMLPSSPDPTTLATLSPPTFTSHLYRKTSQNNLSATSLRVTDL